ncbi:hypothetical protein ACPTI4_31795, partial [Pseudomonas aeruginosa]
TANTRVRPTGRTISYGLFYIHPRVKYTPLYVLVPKRHARGAALPASLDRNLRLMRRSGRLVLLIAEAHLERSGQTRT